MLKPAILLISLLASQPAFAQFYERGNTVDDLTQGVTWLRCSVGQRWQTDTAQCIGEAKRLNFEEIEQVIVQANEQLGGEWRLPTKAELQQLLCEKCISKAVRDNDPNEEEKLVPAMIDQSVFPNTAAEPYWSSTKNWIAPRNRWSVNFMTGDSYGRFFPEQRLAVRLLRDR
ncbi:DUF1566 domain-containing protein [Nereida sp.]|uniref:Lcl C-terminal domain-containing protein n=1 Tax=Nereida sp. TaxID=2736090 RepID=UPI003F6A36C7